MSIAQVVATRSTCPRKFVGAVLVRNRTILSTGYNGSIRGMPHCTDVGHMMEDDHCVATIHAEANAIIQAARNGVMIDGATNYVTASPCWNCFKQLANAGVTPHRLRRVLSRRAHLRVAKRLGIELLHFAESRGDAASLTPDLYVMVCDRGTYGAARAAKSPVIGCLQPATRRGESGKMLGDRNFFWLTAYHNTGQAG